MDTPVLPSTTQKFLSRPEGKVGLIPPLLLVGAGIYWWGSILPFLVTAADNTLHLVVVVGALFAIGFLVFDKTWRTLAFYFYRSLMRWITAWFINIDPIGIQKTYLERYKEKREELDESLASIRGLQLEQSRRIQRNQAEFDKSFARCQVSQRDGNTRVYTLESKQVDRLTKLLDHQKTSSARFDFIVTVLSRYRDVCDDEITDIGRDIDARIQDQQEGRAFQKGMRAAKAILRGLPEKEMYDESTAVLEQRYSQAIGEVEQLMDVTKDIISTADLDDAAAAEMMDQKLKQWREKNSGMAIGKSTKAEIANSAEAIALPPPEQTKVKEGIPR